MAFHGGEVGAVRPAVACARCNRNRAAARLASIREFERERLSPFRRLAIEPRNLGWDHHLRAEFLRLVECSPGKGLTRNSSGEAEIVLDSCARPRLPAEGP